MRDVGLDMAQPMLPACVHADQASKATGYTTKPTIVHSTVLLEGRSSLSVLGNFNARPDCERYRVGCQQDVLATGQARSLAMRDLVKHAETADGVAAHA